MSRPTKTELRANSLEVRRSLSPESVKEWSGLVCRQLLGLESYQGSKTIGLYVDLPGEVVTRSLFEACFAAGKRVAVPAHVGERGYVFAWVGPETRWARGAYDCEEPVEPDVLGDDELLDVVVVPGVAFSKTGARLGFGKGYYDRLLGGPNCVGAVCVGLGFERLVLEEVPVESHDRVMDVVLTEKGAYRAGTV